MKKFTLLLSLVALLVSCSPDEVSQLKEEPCHCTRIHKFYRFQNNQWVLQNTTVENLTNPDCSTNGSFQTVMHTDPTGGWSVKEDIVINCN